MQIYLTPIDLQAARDRISWTAMIALGHASTDRSISIECRMHQFSARRVDFIYCVA